MESDSIRYEIRPRALKVRALNLVLMSLVPVIPYVFYLHHVGSQLPNDEVIDNSFRLILTGGLGSVIWVMICLFAVPDLWAEDWSITIGDGWIELPKAGRIHASEIAGVRSVSGLVHSRIEIELESDHPDSETIPAVYPHEYGGGHDLNPRIFSLWDQHRHHDDDRPQGSAIASQRTGATKLYYVRSNDGHSQPDGFTHEEVLADGALILENIDTAGETRWLGCVTTNDVELLVVWNSETQQRP